MEKIDKWKETLAKLKKYKKEEIKLRKEICEEMFKGKTGEFTVTLELENGMYAKAYSKVSRVVDKGVLTAIWSEMSEKEKQVFKMKPALQIKAYRELPTYSIVHEAITEKPATPVLEVK